MPWSKEVTNTAFKAFRGIALVDYSALKIGKGEKRENEKGQPVAKTFKVLETLKVSETENTDNIRWTKAQFDAMWQYADKLRIRKYSESTFKTYGTYFKQFLAAHPNSARRIPTRRQAIAN